MPVSQLHEVLVSLFRARQTLAVELLRGLPFEVPSHTDLRLIEADLGQVQPVEARADAALLLKSEDRPVLGVVVEVQLRKDPQKLRSWPMYATTFRYRHGCPTIVLVVTPSASVAKWAAKAIALGGGNTFRVQVLGPSQIPAVTEAMAPPELALLSARIHRDREDVVEAATLSLLQLDEPTRLQYHDVLMGWLSPAMQKKVLDMVLQKYPYPQSDFAKEHYGKGRREGEAALLLRLLARRFGALPEVVVARVQAAESEEIVRWGDRVLDADRLEAVFASD